VNKGALLTVEDGPKGIRFRKYREHDRLDADDIAEAAEFASDPRFTYLPCGR
jgi:hypothetical protein